MWIEDTNGYKWIKPPSPQKDKAGKPKKKQPEPEVLICEFCGGFLKPKQRRFCCKSCKNSFYYNEKA